ncbi:hypothetical protein DFP72DRAFT_1064874 [Ephemerocybe angulata]|uniref:DNA repair protein REV1 n=1 Tax=Ephemerocybe angulata TaxID=980116 RepID=A0A8H6M7X5_9AGAR|nr:hypothetical protein DFP72DRAFT_1064874 [Tulosesus angulatus]
MASQDSSEYYFDDDSQFLNALQNIVLPGDIEHDSIQNTENILDGLEDGLEDASQESEELEPPPPGQPRPSLKRDYSQVEEDDWEEPDQVDEAVYGAAHFDNFGEYMRRKRAKLQIQNSQIGQGSQIFKGLAIYINGWTQPSVQDLRQMIVEHGGVFQPYLDKKGLVTHIITCSLTPAKLQEFKHMKVARPEWLLESIKAGTLLPWRDYKYVPEGRDDSSQGSKPKQQQSSLSMETQARQAAIEPLYVTDPKSTKEAAAVPGYASAVSNPNARRAMANPEWRKAHTSVSADFIDGYYKNSRLHHLSTWKSELKDLVHEAQERAEATHGGGHLGKVAAESGVSMRGMELPTMKSPSKSKGKNKAVVDHDRVIMHCDFDCFFVSAGLVSRPELKGKPVVVCHSQGNTGGTSSTSEIASCSYEARKFGLKNGMSLRQGRTLCPDLVTIPYEFDRYKQFSLQFYTVLMSHADDLQAVSVDEALIDVSDRVAQLRRSAGYEGSQYDPAKDYAETIRAEVRKATNCEISIGISHNILLARLATRKAKPGGSFHLLPEDVPEFLAPLEVSDLHGIGYHTKQKAQEKLGTTNLGELSKKSKSQLIDALGKATGEKLYNGLRGVDDKQIESDKPRKSVSCEINYGIRFENNEQAEQFIYQMAVEVKKRLDAIDMLGRSITLKIMKRDATAPEEPAKFLGHGPCDLFSKQGPLIGPGGKATSDDQIIGEFAWRLLKSFDFDPKDLRGIGLQVQKLESASSSNIPAGQAVLPFKRMQDSSRSGPSHRQATPTIADAVQALPQHPPPEPTKRAEQSFDLPSFSQVDMSVFNALPPSLQAELKNEYSRRSASPFTSVGVGDPPAPKPAPAFVNKPTGFPARRSITPVGVFPARSSAKEVNVKRITHQLAPQNRTNLSPQKSLLFALMKKKPPKQVSSRTSEAKLRELGIDPEVFASLPKQVQDEQLVRARILKEKGSLPEPPSQRIILKAKKPTHPPGFVPYRAPAPKARFPEVPVLRQRGKAKGEKLAFTEADDVQRIMEAWVATYKHWAPRDKDIEYLSKFLLQSVDSEYAGGVGVEKAVAVMKWWMVLLRRTWPGSEPGVDDDDEDEDEDGRGQVDTIGKAWWDAFWKVKREMDVVARRKFGGSLSLR